LQFLPGKMARRAVLPDHVNENNSSPLR